MPVQINEMIIRANIKEPDTGAKAEANPAGGGGEVNREELIRECAALVMEMLQEKNQR